MSRPNKCIKDETGKEYWISRSTVVIPIVFKLNNETGEIFTLVEKRGKSVSHTGEWCCPCGYLDWDETFEDACIREVKEETGLELDKPDVIFFSVDTNIYTSNQSVDLWFMCWGDCKDFDKSKIETVDEVSDISWLRVAKVYSDGPFYNRKIHMDIYKKSIIRCYGIWAFKQHPVKIIEMLKSTIKGDGKIVELDE